MGEDIREEELSAHAYDRGFAAGKAEGVAQVQAYAEKEARAAEMRAGLIPQEADSNNAVAYAARSIARKATTEHSDALTSMLAEARAEGERRAWTAAERLIETNTKLGSEMPFPSPTVGGLLEGFAEARHNLPSAISGLLRAAEERTKQR